MNPDIKAQWVADLRSGDYEQGRAYLHTQPEQDGLEKFCCLGVLCDQAVKAGVIQRQYHPDENFWTYGKDVESLVLPSEVMEWAGMTDSNPELRFKKSSSDVNSLADLNDTYNWTFEKIADLIEREL